MVLFYELKRIANRFFFGHFGPSAACFSSIFVHAIAIGFVISPSASKPTYIGTFGHVGAEKESCDQSDEHVSQSLMIFVNSVLGFFPWCNSKGVFFSPVCTVNRLTRNARFTLSVRIFPFSKFAITRFFNIWIARSTVPFAVCIRGVQYSFSIFRFLQNSRYSFEIKAPALSDLIFFPVFRTN